MEDAQFQKDLSLTSDQSARIDSIFQATIALLRQKKAELDRQEAELSRLIEANADEGRSRGRSTRSRAIRANLNKTRTLMLLRMRQVLTPDQRVQLNKLLRSEHRQRQRQTREDRSRRTSRQPGNGETRQ